MNNTMTTTVHPEYAAKQLRWVKNRDVCDGEDAVKAKGRAYLPDDNEAYLNGVPQGSSIRADGPDPDRFERKYQHLIGRASFMGFSGHTRNGWVGMAFNNDPVVKLPASMQYLEENVDGGGQSLTQLAKRCLSDVVEIGRYGFLSDAPQTGGNVSQSEADEMGLLPHVIGYRAEDIIDWGEMEIGGKTVLSMVKTRRQFYERDDDDDMSAYGELKNEYTVHRLQYPVDEDGNQIAGSKLQWTYQRYDEQDIPIDEMPVVITDAKGGSLDRIQFFFAGAENNKPDVDNAPLDPIVDINLSHYRNSADEEALNHTHAAPMLGIDVGMSQTSDQFKVANPNGIRTGDAVITANGGSIDYKQIGADSSISNLIESKEARAEKLGANFAGEGKSKDVTAEAARINAAFTTSTLSTCVDNVSEALEAALEGVALLMGNSGESIEFSLSTEFYGTTKDWQAFESLKDAYDRGFYTWEGFVLEASKIGFTLDGDGSAAMP